MKPGAATVTAKGFVTTTTGCVGPTDTRTPTPDAARSASSILVIYLRGRPSKHRFRSLKSLDLSIEQRCCSDLYDVDSRKAMDCVMASYNRELIVIAMNVGIRMHICE